MTQSNADAAQFRIEMTPKQAELAETALRMIGVDFSPMNSVFIVDEDNDCMPYIISSNIGELIDDANRRYYGDGEDPPQIPQPKDLEQTIEAVQLLYHEFRYKKWQVDEEFWRETGQTWEEVQAKYPRLFAEDHGN